MTYLAPILYFCLSNVFDCDLKPIMISHPGVDNSESTFAKNMINLVGLFKRFSGVHGGMTITYRTVRCR